MKRDNITVAYAISDTLFYWEMLRISVASLRKYEPDIPISIYAFGEMPRSAKKWINTSDVNFFSHSAAKAGDGWLLKWIALGQVRTENVLLLDVDTVITRPLKPFFKRYSKADFYARKELGMDTVDWQGPIKVPRRLDQENYAKAARDIGAKVLPVFNSGVMLWNRGVHEKFLMQLPTFLEMVTRVRTQKGAQRIVSRAFFADEIAGALTLGTLRDVTTGFITPVDSPFYTERRFAKNRDRGFITHINTAYYVDWAADNALSVKEVRLLKDSMKASKITPVDWGPLIAGESQFPSAKILAERIEPLFKNKPWIVDSIFEFSPRTPEKNCNVVFMGNFLLEFSQILTWPEKNYHFNVLAGGVKRVLSQVFGVDKKVISVFKRNELFPLPQAAALPPLSERVDFIYGGRLSEAKNIFLLTELISVLQTTHGLDARLSLCGNFDGHRAEDEGLAEIEANAFAAKFQRFVKKLKWQDQPIVRHGLGPNDWLKKTLASSVGISLSTHMKEDFGVALAEEQQHGLPLVVSAWGAHLDLSNTIQIPVRLISHPSATAEVRTKSAHAIAKYLIANWELSISKPPKDDGQKNKWLTHRQLFDLQKKSSKKYPGFFKIASQKELFAYLKTPAGRRLMKAYRTAFSDTREQLRR